MNEQHCESGTTRAEERIRSFVIENGEWHGPPSALTHDLALVNNVLDSVGLLKLVALLEDEFGIEIKDNELVLDNFRTIGRLLSFIERKGRDAGTGS